MISSSGESWCRYIKLRLAYDCTYVYVFWRFVLCVTSFSCVIYFGLPLMVVLVFFIQSPTRRSLTVHHHVNVRPFFFLPLTCLDLNILNNLFFIVRRTHKRFTHMPVYNKEIPRYCCMV